MAEQIIVCSFHDRLAEALALRHIKPIDLAKKTNISRGAISQYINGKVKPKQDKISTMATALRVSPTWLMGYDVPIDDNAPQYNEDESRPSVARREKITRRIRERAIRRRTIISMEVSLAERELIENFRSIQAVRIQRSIQDLVEMLAYPDLASLPPNSEISDIEMKEMIKRSRGDLVDEPDDLDAADSDMDDKDEQYL